MKTATLLYSLQVLAALCMQGIFSAPLSPSESLIDTATIKNISDAILQATYVSQISSNIVDNLPVNNTDPSVCFIEPRDPNTDVPPMDRLRQDRSWIDSFYNYTSDVYRAQCGNLRELDQKQVIICIDLVNMLEKMETLAKELDHIIIPPEEEGAGEGEPETGKSCWDLTSHQQYWNFNALHGLAAVYIKTNLEDLQAKLTHKTMA